jgi:hypothetical protein
VADRALACVVHQAGLPRILLDALLEGFAWDAEGRRYETLEDLHDYAARVAGTVGAMMSMVMDTRSPSALARACELGLAMQLTNIARDVGEDARAGRLYLPLQWLREAGIDPDAWLQQPEFSPAIAKVVQRLLHAADTLYRRAERGVAELPRDCRPAIQAARLVYAEIGREIEAAGFDSVNRRAVVSRHAASWPCMAQACTAVVVAPAAAAGASPALPAVRLPGGRGGIRATAATHLLRPHRARHPDLLERASHRRRTRMTPPVACHWRARCTHTWAGRTEAHAAQRLQDWKGLLLERATRPFGHEGGGTAPRRPRCARAGACGVDGVISKPACSARARTSGDPSAATMSRCSCASTGAGVPARPTSAAQGCISTGGPPASASVGNVRGGWPGAAVRPRPAAATGRWPSARPRCSCRRR